MIEITDSVLIKFLDSATNKFEELKEYNIKIRLYYLEWKKVK